MFCVGGADVQDHLDGWCGRSLVGSWSRWRTLAITFCRMGLRCISLSSFPEIHGYP